MYFLKVHFLNVVSKEVVAAHLGVSNLTKVCFKSIYSKVYFLKGVLFNLGIFKSVFFIAYLSKVHFSKVVSKSRCVKYLISARFSGVAGVFM